MKLGLISQLPSRLWTVMDGEKAKFHFYLFSTTIRRNQSVKIPIARFGWKLREFQASGIGKFTCSIACLFVRLIAVLAPVSTARSIFALRIAHLLAYSLAYEVMGLKCIRLFHVISTYHIIYLL